MIMCPSSPASPRPRMTLPLSTMPVPMPVPKVTTTRDGKEEEEDRAFSSSFRPERPAPTQNSAAAAQVASLSRQDGMPPSCADIRRARGTFFHCGMFASPHTTCSEFFDCELRKEQGEQGEQGERHPAPTESGQQQEKLLRRLKDSRLWESHRRPARRRRRRSL